jgi:hypothetical protein
MVTYNLEGEDSGTSVSVEYHIWVLITSEKHGSIIARRNTCVGHRDSAWRRKI